MTRPGIVRVFPSLVGTLPLNAGLLFLGRLCSAGTTLVLLAAIGHGRGGEALASVAIGMALGTIVATVSDGGLGSLFVRESIRAAALRDGLWTLLLLIRVVTVAAMLPVILIIAPVFGTDTETVFWAGSGLLFQQAAEMSRSVFIAQGRMHVAAYHTIIENLSWLLVTMTLLLDDQPLHVAVAGGAGVLFLSWQAGIVLALRAGHLRLRWPSRGLTAATARQARPFLLFACVGILYSRLDGLLLAHLAPEGSIVIVGAFLSAQRLLGAFEYVAESTARALYPNLVHRMGESGFLIKTLRNPLRGLLAVACVLPGVAVLAGDRIMSFLFGPSLAEYGGLLAALAIAVPARWVGQVLGVVLTATQQQGKRVLAATAALVITVSVNVALIPAFGVVVALASYLGASLLVGGVYLAAVGCETRMFVLKVGGQLLLCSLILVLVIIVTSGTSVSVWLIVLYAFAYGLLAWLVLR